MAKKYLLLVVLVTVFSLPTSLSAATITELQAQVAVLITQITALKGHAVAPATPLVSDATLCPNLTRNLYRGSRGGDVTQFQQFLISKKLLATDYATGFFGAMTESAVKLWQCQHMRICSGSANTNGYGAVGPKTRAAITSTCTASITPSVSTTPITPSIPVIPTNPMVPIAPTTPPTTASCTPLASQTQTLSCPSGQTGSITQSRSSSCAMGAVTPTWSAWSTTSSTCIVPTPVTPIVTNVPTSLAPRMCTAAAPLDGTFIDLESVNEFQIGNVLEELHSLHMEALIINATRAIGSSCSATSYYWLGGLSGKLEKILSEADTLNMKVYVGLTSTMHQCDSVRNPAVFYEEPLASATKADYIEAVKYIEQNYSGHTSLAGWYIPDEPNVVSWQLPLVYPYYRGLVDGIRTQSNRPVLIAPYLVGARGKTPAEIADRAKLFQDNTGVDIQVWQDSVGADAIPTNYRNGPDLSAYLRAIGEKIGSAKLWADIELFSYGTNKAGGWYSPASIMRLNQQLWLASNGSVTKKVSWIGATHMSALNSSQGNQANRLFDGYRALYCSVDTMLKPISYAWLTPPSNQYPDSGNELTDTVTATPLSYNDAAWVGIHAQQNGHSKIQLDFGATRTVRWVSMHLLHYALAGIEFPDSMTVECSTDNISWVTAGTWNLSISKGNSEYVFSNDQPLNVQCRHVKLTLTGGIWHFMSELEIVGH